MRWLVGPKGQSLHFSDRFAAGPKPALMIRSRDAKCLQGIYCDSDSCYGRDWCFDILAGLVTRMLTVRPARAEDAQSIGDLSQQFSRYLRQLGDLTDFKLTGETYLRFGFGS